MLKEKFDDHRIAWQKRKIPFYASTYDKTNKLCQMFMKEVFGEQLPDTFDEETLTTINKFFENNHQALVKENHLEDKVELGGTFCMGDCVNGVNVTVDGEKHSVSPDTTEEFFQKEILAKVQ